MNLDAGRALAPRERIGTALASRLGNAKTVEFFEGDYSCAPSNIAALLLIAATPLAASAAAPTSVAAAVASNGRSADNVKLDESRKPAPVLEFLGLRPGMSALDLFGGNRYWAEIMAPAVGPEGPRDWCGSRRQFLDADSKKAFAEFKAKQPQRRAGLDARSRRSRCRRTRTDFVMINLDYHDVYWESAKYGIPRMEPQTLGSRRSMRR